MDPELDEPVTGLGFVHEVGVHDGVARVRLRLPTYFCAPNFAWMMGADAHDAVRGVAGVVRADVRLDDYFASDEINAGVASAAGFVARSRGKPRQNWTSCASPSIARRIRLPWSGCAASFAGRGWPRLISPPWSSETAGLPRRRALAPASL